MAGKEPSTTAPVSPTAGEVAPSTRALTLVPGTSLRRTDSPNPAAVVPHRGRAIAYASWAMPGLGGIAIALASLNQLRTPHPHSLVVAVCTWACLGPLFFRRRWNRVFERASIWLASAIRNRASGRIHVTGTVASSSYFPTAVAGRPAVLARYQGGASADETHGIDFHLVADDGARFLVHVSDQTFLDAAPSRARRDAQAECSIGPGDRVTVDGVVVAEVDAGSDRAGPRETPLRLALVGSEDAPLVIRPSSP